MLTALGATFTIPYPPSYRKLLHWLGTVNLSFLEIGPITCAVPLNFYHYLVIHTLMPLGIIVDLFIAGKLRPTIKDKCFTTSFLVIFLVYPSVCAKVFATFVCSELDEDLEGSNSYLRADLSISCNGPWRSVMLAYATVMIVIYPIGVPLLYAYLLFWKHREHLLELAYAEMADEAEKTLLKVQMKVARQSGESADTHRFSNAPKVQERLCRTYFVS